MTDTVMPRVKVEEIRYGDEVIYRARVQVRGSPRFHVAEGKEPSEALLLVAARWHAYKDL